MAHIPNERPFPPPLRYRPLPVNTAQNGGRGGRAPYTGGRHYGRFNATNNGRGGVRRDLSYNNNRNYDPNYYNRANPVYGTAAVRNTTTNPNPAYPTTAAGNTGAISYPAYGPAAAGTAAANSNQAHPTAAAARNTDAISNPVYATAPAGNTAANLNPAYGAAAARNPAENSNPATAAAAAARNPSANSNPAYGTAAAAANNSNPAAYATAAAGNNAANYSHLEQVVRNLQSEIAEMKALHQKEISEIRSLHASDVIQIKAAIKASHNELKAASEVIYSELQASYSSIATKSRDEFSFIKRLILDLNNIYTQSPGNTSRVESIAALPSQPSLAITDGTRSGHNLHLNSPVYNNLSQQSSTHFGEILGPRPHDDEQSVNTRLKSLEQFITPLKDEVEITGGRVRFLSFGTAVGGGVDDDEDEVEDLSEDIYSILFVSAPFSISFFFTIMMSFSQFFISALIIIDLLQDRERPFDVENDNPYKLPAKVDWQVACAQFSSLIIAFVTEKEVITSAKMLLVGYDPTVTKISPGATYAKFILSNLLRFLSGLITIFVSVLIIMQSSEVLEIFMNFAAVAFISDLDNIAFETANDGLLGLKLKAATERVQETKVKVQKKDYSWLVNILFILLFIPFLLGLSFVRLRQSNGVILASTSCQGLFVQFGDEDYQISTGVNFTFVGEGVNKTFPNSTRKLPLLNEVPPLLLYQYFSGRYIAEQQNATIEKLEEYKARPVYWERGFKDPTSGKFYYCDKIKAWVFTIEILFDTPGVIPPRAKKECEWGWLMQSPATEAITLDEATDKNWIIWTGKVEHLEDPASFSIRCTDCDRDTDCGLNNGRCLDSGECECNEGWQGISCSVPDPFCPNLAWINYGESAYEYSETRDYFIIPDDDGKPYEFYGRPVYAMFEFGEVERVEIILYTGGRWFDTFFAFENLDVINNDFHGYWDNILDFSTQWYSDPTDSMLPTGFEWNEIQPSKSKGTFGAFGYSIKVASRFECLHVDCVGRPSVCGEKGKCVEGAEILWDLTLDEGISETNRHNCECLEDFGGFYCERDPTGPYAVELYEEYSANPTLFAASNPNMTYLKFFDTETEGNIFREGEL